MLRAARRKRHRLGDIEWFEAAYRVYLVALFGGGTVLWLSGLRRRRHRSARRAGGRRRQQRARPCSA